ncbi:hypothetical protein [Pukyongiella litopenaei]|uniref:Uncharacterized protein n=1 Tax=Pukyongiella litopenaei TaxID=2605946 RepID=A0A2S0MLE9_9RHOB|nr:hypothetical protein [Pukyongiella litopenaei]AVO36591.2 hypothetical protein C6Y53_02000 [Pukyongiella litopenaei]
MALAGDVEAQAQAGEVSVVGEYDGEETYFADGVATARPALPEITATGQGWSFASQPPAGIMARTDSRLYAEPVEITAQEVHLGEAVALRVYLDAPWPYLDAEFDLTGDATSEPPGAQVIAPTLTAQDAARSDMILTPQQLLTGLVADGWITAAEGLAWAEGNGLPAAATTLIASMPASEQFAAQVRLLRMETIRRTDPLVIALAYAEGKTDTDIDTFFTTHAA